MWYNLIEASLLIYKNWDSVGMEPSVLVTHGHQRPGLASNCPGVVKEWEEKQGLAFPILVLETGYLSGGTALSVSSIISLAYVSQKRNKTNRFHF